MNFCTHKKTSGFTLIELLVVISIISLLSSVVMSGLSSARAKARDSKRLQGVVQLRNALEIYRTSNQGYPGAIAANSGVISVNSGCTTAWNSSPYGATVQMTGSNALGDLVTQNIISQIGNQSDNYCFYYINEPAGMLFGQYPWLSCGSPLPPQGYLVFFQTEKPLNNVPQLYQYGSPMVAAGQPPIFQCISG